MQNVERAASVSCTPTDWIPLRDGMDYFDPVAAGRDVP